MPAEAAPALDRLERRGTEALRLGPANPITATAQAERFLRDVALALRYGPGKGLPLASLYLAFAGPRPARAAMTRALTLTNHLIGTAQAIECMSSRIA